MDWNINRGPAGEWAWTLGLPNGWWAGVADPVLPTCTAYHMFASSKDTIVQVDTPVHTLELAKSLALELALVQQPVVISIKQKRSRVY